MKPSCVQSAASIATQVVELWHSMYRIHSYRNRELSLNSVVARVVEALSSTVVKVLCYKPDGCGFDTQ
jgi:hypothetical protein